MPRNPAWLRTFVAVRCRASRCRYQLDKLGVTGSSPVPPTSRKPRSSGVFRFQGQTTAEWWGTAWQPNGNVRAATMPSRDDAELG